MTKKGIALFSIIVPLAAALFGLGSNFGGKEKRIAATGVVYHDANGNRRFDDGEKPLANVRVSNGREIVKTDANGRYSLDIDDDTILFVIQPSGWKSPVNKEMLPQFYYIHKPKGSPKQKYRGSAPTGPLPDSVDFPLYPQKQPKKFKAILFGDPQPRTQKEVDYIGHDVVEELIGTDASFGVTLGDVVFDDLSLFQPQAKAIGLIGIPWYNVIGNHDINMDAKNRKDANETFESVFGPSYYSFDYGTTHFLVLDDIDWYESESTDAKTKKKKKSWRYRGGLGKKQMEFIRNDLAMIPKKQLVVLLMHIPLVNVEDRQELYRLIEQRPFCMSISGHTHFHQHVFIKKKDGWRGPKPHHHIINVTVCGSWWRGAPDERGIPHTMMRDGAPNGYSIITFDGTKYALDFRAAGKPASYQMNIHAPEVVDADKTETTKITVNVFNGSERSRVKMRIGKSAWIPMKNISRRDPSYKKLIRAEKEILNAFKENKPFFALPAPHKTPHLWSAHLPAKINPGTHILEVHTVDMHGREFRGYRVIRIQEVKPVFIP